MLFITPAALDSKQFRAFRVTRIGSLRQAVRKLHQAQTAAS
jgi:hypothetical protein